MPFVTSSDGVQIYVEEEGSGVPVVLIPGLGGSATFWNSIGPILSQSYRVILFDHRGAGRSERPSQEYTIEGIARDVIEILDHFKIEAAHVVGHSTGGAVAQVLALDAPHRVKRLVLSATWDKADYRFRCLFNVRAAVLDACGPEVYQDLTHILAYQPEWMNAHAEQLNVASQQAEASLDPIDVSVARIHMLCDFDRSAELEKITAPTLVAGAVDDGIVPFYYSEKIAAAIPKAKLAHFSGGHFFPRLHPQAFADAVAAFFEAPGD